MLFRSIIFACLLLSGACVDTRAPESDLAHTPDKKLSAEIFSDCTDPRPELCTQQYEPVCASRDTGIRCVTTPCDSAEWKTYSNACMACADKAVFGYKEGECKEPNATAETPGGGAS